MLRWVGRGTVTSWTGGVIFGFDAVTGQLTCWYTGLDYRHTYQLLHVNKNVLSYYIRCAGLQRERWPWESTRASSIFRRSMHADKALEDGEIILETILHLLYNLASLCPGLCGDYE